MLRKVLFWVGYWARVVIIMEAVGGLAGVILYPLVGSLIGMDYTFGFMAREGLMDGLFYALVWAPGTAIVLCFRKGYILVQEREKASGTGSAN